MRSVMLISITKPSIHIISSGGTSRSLYIYNISRLAMYQTLSSKCPSLCRVCAPCIRFIYRFPARLCVLLFVGFSFLILFLFLCSRWSFVDAPPIFSCPADHVLLPDWPPRIFLGMVEARSVNVNEKNIHTHTHTHTWEDQCEWHRMTRMTEPDCAVMCNLINTHHTHTHTHTQRKKCRKERRVGSVAANPDNLGSNKKAGGGAQGAQGSSKICTSRESVSPSVSPLSRLIRGFRNKYH